jgi:hypothetical protein
MRRDLERRYGSVSTPRLTGYMNEKTRLNKLYATRGAFTPKEISPRLKLSILYTSFIYLSS